jgi:hypothetical protein
MKILPPEHAVALSRFENIKAGAQRKNNFLDELNAYNTIITQDCKKPNDMPDKIVKGNKVNFASVALLMVCLGLLELQILILTPHL